MQKHPRTYALRFCYNEYGVERNSMKPLDSEQREWLEALLWLSGAFDQKAVSYGRPVARTAFWDGESASYGSWAVETAGWAADSIPNMLSSWKLDGNPALLVCDAPADSKFYHFATTGFTVLAYAGKLEPGTYMFSFPASWLTDRALDHMDECPMPILWSDCDGIGAPIYSTETIERKGTDADGVLAINDPSIRELGDGFYSAIYDIPETGRFWFNEDQQPGSYRIRSSSMCMDRETAALAIEDITFGAQGISSYPILERCYAVKGYGKIDKMAIEAVSPRLRDSIAEAYREKAAFEKTIGSCSELWRNGLKHLETGNRWRISTPDKVYVPTADWGKLGDDQQSVYRSVIDPLKEIIDDLGIGKMAHTIGSGIPYEDVIGNA